MWRFSLSFLLLVSACATPPERDLAEIRTVLNQQVSAWNQGDIDAYMAGYWNDPRLVFTGGKNITRGWQQALERYKESYPTSDRMGELKFDDLDVELLSETVAYSTGEWNLFRTSDTLSGRFTLVWKKIGGDWFIIADHSS